MAYRAPLHPLSLEGITPEERQRDRERVGRLREYLPPISDTTELVQEYFRAHLTSSVQSSIGEPVKVLRRLLEQDPTLAARLNLAPEELESKIAEILDADSGPEPEILDREARHAHEEYLRHWLDTALFAWKLSGKKTGVLSAGPHLIPIVDDSGAWEEWAEYERETNSYLENNVALTKEGLSRTAQTFANNLRKHTKQADIELPRKLALAFRNERDCFVARS
jgi:hypothetical protein